MQMKFNVEDEKLAREEKRGGKSEFFVVARGL